MSSLELCIFSPLMFGLLWSQLPVDRRRDYAKLQRWAQKRRLWGPQGSMWPHCADGEGHSLSRSVEPHKTWSGNTAHSHLWTLPRTCFPKSLPSLRGKFSPLRLTRLTLNLPPPISLLNFGIAILHHHTQLSFFVAQWGITTFLSFSEAASLAP